MDDLSYLPSFSFFESGDQPVPRKSAEELATNALLTRLNPPPPVPDPPSPPPHLGQPEIAIWNHLHREYDLDYVAGTFLGMALSAHQRQREIRTIIECDGAVVTRPNGKQEPHCLLPAERGAWRTYCATIKLLKLQPGRDVRKSGPRYDHYGNRIA